MVNLIICDGVQSSIDKKYRCNENSLKIFRNVKKKKYFINLRDFLFHIDQKVDFFFFVSSHTSTIAMKSSCTESPVLGCGLIVKRIVSQIASEKQP